MAKFFDHITGFIVDDNNAGTSQDTIIILQKSATPKLQIGSDTNYGHLITSNEDGKGKSQSIFGETFLKCDSNHSINLTNSNIEIKGDANSTLTLGNKNILTNGLEITGSLKANSGLIVENGLTVTGSTKFNSGITVDNGAIINSGATINSSLTVNGTTTLNDGATINGRGLTVAGPLYANNNALSMINSNLTIEKQVSAQNFLARSDIRLKENIKEFNKGLDILDKIEVKSYNWKDDKEKQLNVGCIAQQLQEILPDELKDFYIQKDNNNYLVVNESKLIYLLINAVKDLQNEIKKLQK